MKGISLGYIGVHQIFQLALGAQEIDALDGLFVSMLGRCGWGRWISKINQAKSLYPLGHEQLDVTKIWQYPWPLLSRSLRGRSSAADVYASNCWFDNRMASWIAKMNSRIFVGEETCSELTFRAAEKLGMIRILDCAGVPSTLLDEEAQIAASHFGLKINASSNQREMLDRKSAELALANTVLCCSEYQRRQLTKLHPHLERTEVCPLWADSEFWRAADAKRRFSESKEPLRILYAGAISLRKGVPYLLEAMEMFSASEAKLTLVGALAPELSANGKFQSMLGAHSVNSAVRRETLRDLFAEHDLLVMPTLGDSFGFIILEALSSGLPVIVSENAGAPVPDLSWRFPIHDANSISRKLATYVSNRQLLHSHSKIAIDFAGTYTPQRYRAQVSTIFREQIDAS